MQPSFDRDHTLNHHEEAEVKRHFSAASATSCDTPVGSFDIFGSLRAREPFSLNEPSTSNDPTGVSQEVTEAAEEREWTHVDVLLCNIYKQMFVIEKKYARSRS
jgi:hypothetical protein